jgi:hypothetical protein
MKFIAWLLILFLAGDLIFSFIQHYHRGIDGDFARLALPDPWNEAMLNDPLAIQAVFHNQKYSGTNRFLCHWSLVNYFRIVPEALQTVFTPIESLFLSAALFKLAVQFALIFLLTLLVAEKKRFFSAPFLVIACLITALFQSQGFYVTTGIIDQSISYVFFYGFPFALLLILIYLFKENFFRQNPLLSFPRFILLTGGGLALSLSSPLIAPLLAIYSGIFLFYFNHEILKKGNLVTGIKQASRFSFSRVNRNWLFILFILFSAYSIYAGTFNNENAAAEISIGKSHSLLVNGILMIFTLNSGFAILGGLVIVACLVVFMKGDQMQKSNLRKQLFLIMGGLAIYIALLPLGGFREYRPFILRYDTWMPVTLGCIYLLALTGSMLWQIELVKRKAMLLAGLVIFFFTVMDAGISENTRCQKKAMKRLAESRETVVKLDAKCNLLSWEKISNPEASLYQSRMLQKLNILQGEKLYYQVE